MSVRNAGCYFPIVFGGIATNDERMMAVLRDTDLAQHRLGKFLSTDGPVVPESLAPRIEFQAVPYPRPDAEGSLTL